MSTSKVMRTYGSRPRPPLPSSPPSGLSSSPNSSPIKRNLKRTFDESFASSDALPFKRRPKSVLSGATNKSKAKAKSHDVSKPKPKQKVLTQLHFSVDTTILRTCPLCDLSYTKGAPDDEALHKAHCARVLKGMEWGREEEREQVKVGVEEVAVGVKLKNGKKGRIICFKADAGGKIGQKLTVLLETINLALSSPPLTPEVLQASKVYLMLIPVITGASHREKIVGCVIAQRISTAMAIATPSPTSATSTPSRSTADLIPVDASSSLFCHPAPLPTPLGIPRLFVPSTHRRQGIASHLLSAAANTFIHGCPLDPAKGEVAFTQPTGAGGSVMKAWGGGGVRIYEE